MPCTLLLVCSQYNAEIRHNKNKDHSHFKFFLIFELTNNLNSTRSSNKSTYPFLVFSSFRKGTFSGKEGGGWFHKLKYVK